MNTLFKSILDIERLRRETPGCAHVVHLNNAGAGLMPAPVLAAMTEYLTMEATIGAYETAGQREADLEGVYASIARLINARPEEIAVVENATRAWDMAFYAIPFAPGDRILTAASEYASNVIAFLQMAQRRGVSVEVIPCDETGQVSVDALAAMMDERVKLVAITHVPTNGGLINPAAEIGQVAKAYGALFLLDACQSIGQLPVDVQAIGCDMLSATGRKFLRGPRGIGFLYVNRAILASLEPPMLDLHAATWTGPATYEMRPDARRFENWECNFAGKVGLGVAVDYALALGMDAIWQRIRTLGHTLRTALADLPGLHMHDLGQNKGGIVTFTVDGLTPAGIKQALAVEKINVSVSPREYTLYDMTARNLDCLVRASVHCYNTESELARVCDIWPG